jgi:5,10-methylenetetrahydromethanopterin reductase
MAPLPKIGVRLHSGMNSLRCVELASEADELGFDSIWFAENPYERGVLPTIGACAVKTERIKIGVGVFNPFNRHPSLMAMEIGALDELSKGRALLGIGSGVPGWMNKIVRHEKPLAALRDAGTIAGGLLEGRSIRHEGALFSARDVKLGFALTRTKVPLYLAAMGEQALTVCGAVADGLIVGNMCPPEFTRYARQQMLAAASAAGRAAPQAIVKYVPCSISTRGDDAKRAVKQVIGAMLTSYFKAYDAAPAVQATLVNGNGIEAAEFRAALDRINAGENAAEVLDDRFVAAYAVAGTVDQCLAQCTELASYGASDIVLSFIGADPAQQMGAFADVFDSRK